jgi:hypothetical protein
MNKMLVEWLSILNQVFAAIIVIGGIIVGARFFDGSAIVGGILGYIGGSVAAVLICGAIAVLIDIRTLLSEIAHQLSVNQAETGSPLPLSDELSSIRRAGARRAYARADFGPQTLQ